VAGAATVCKPCGPGEYQGSSSQISCLPCVAGSYSESTATIENGEKGPEVCIITPVGTYQDETKQAVFKECAKNFFSNTLV
jgi:hypothetical protein